MDLIAKLDDVMSRQLNEILAHEKLQRLEATWQGLRMLVEEAWKDHPTTRVRVMSTTLAELQRDCLSATSFEGTVIYRRVYVEEVDTFVGVDRPGLHSSVDDDRAFQGAPYSAIIVDHEFRNDPDDLAVLGQLAAVGAASFATVFCAVSPAVFNVEGFEELWRLADLPGEFRLPRYTAWRSLRSHPDSRFLGMILPRVVIRQAWADDPAQGMPFCWRISTGFGQPPGPLLANAVYAYAQVLMRSFRETGMFLDISGGTLDRLHERGGLVQFDDPTWQSLEPDGAHRLPDVEVVLDDRIERDLANLGFLTMCTTPLVQKSVFFSDSSVFDPSSTRSEDPKSTRLNARLRHVMSASRLAIALRIKAREMIASFEGRDELESGLRSWVTQFVSRKDSASAAERVRYPYRDARVEVQPGLSVGQFRCVMHLSPHEDLEGLAGEMVFESTLDPVKGG